MLSALTTRLVDCKSKNSPLFERLTENEGKTRAETNRLVTAHVQVDQRCSKFCNIQGVETDVMCESNNRFQLRRFRQEFFVVAGFMLI